MGKRVAAAAAKYNITQPCFIINWDQTAVLLQQASAYTMADCKLKQVPMTGKEEKRQITAVVASTLGGDLLPLQLVFTGQDKNKAQQKAVTPIACLLCSALISMLLCYLQWKVRRVGRCCALSRCC